MACVQCESVSDCRIDFRKKVSGCQVLLFWYFQRKFKCVLSTTGHGWSCFLPFWQHLTGAQLYRSRLFCMRPPFCCSFITCLHKRVHCQVHMKTRQKYRCPHNNQLLQFCSPVSASVSKKAYVKQPAHLLLQKLRLLIRRERNQVDWACEGRNHSFERGVFAKRSLWICKDLLTLHSKWSGRNRCKKIVHLSALVKLGRDYAPALSALGYDSTSRFIRPHRMCKRKVPTGKSAKSFPMKV